MGEFLLVALRGTSDILEFFLDITFIQTGVEEYNLPGRAHAGFKIQYDKMRQRLMGAIEEIDAGRNLPLVIAGHSLGGAVGILAALDLQNNGKEIEGLYLSAVPRLGDQELADYTTSQLAGRLYRLEHEQDVVTHVPPRVETKEVLATLLEGVFSLDQIAESAIRTANYGEHAGVGVSFNATRAYRIEGSLDHEMQYWNDLTNNGQGNLLSFILLLTRNLPVHSHEEYVCTFSKPRFPPPVPPAL